METSIKVEATSRIANGKGPARRLRASGKLPAIVYGPGLTGTAIAMDPKNIKTVLTAPMGRNTVFTLEIDGVAQLAMVKSFDIHPMTREVEHADLYSVSLDREIDVEVPFVLVGKSKGVAAGGILQQIYRKLPVRCTPDKIPAKIEADVTSVETGQSVATKTLVLPTGVRVMLDANQTVASIVAAEIDRTEAETPAADAKGAKGKAAAKPAAAAVAAKPAAAAKKK
ncbi:MAG: 50S ribosomal protein L25 [Deltaproteobacteria bacterium]|nr:50S ribosomal protein L25 [Deltaproteobacteria bacterium]